MQVINCAAWHGVSSADRLSQGVIAWPQVRRIPMKTSKKSPKKSKNRSARLRRAMGPHLPPAWSMVHGHPLASGRAPRPRPAPAHVPRERRGTGKGRTWWLLVVVRGRGSKTKRAFSKATQYIAQPQGTICRGFSFLFEPTPGIHSRGRHMPCLSCRRARGRPRITTSGGLLMPDGRPDFHRR